MYSAADYLWASLGMHIRIRIWLRLSLTYLSGIRTGRRAYGEQVGKDESRMKRWAEVWYHWDARCFKMPGAPISHRKEGKIDRGTAVLGGAAVGAALMYVLDPEMGRRRRALGGIR